MTRSLPLLLALALLAPGVRAEEGDSPEVPVSTVPLLAVRCGRESARIDATVIREALPKGVAPGVHLGDGLEVPERSGPVVLEVVDPDLPEDQPTSIWVAPGTALRLQERRPPDHPRVPGLDLLLRWGRVLVCSQASEDAPRPWTTRVITLDGEVLVGAGSAVVQAGELYGNATVTTLRGRAGVAKWGQPWEEEYRVVPAGFRRKVGERGPEAGEAFLWKANPVEFLSSFGLAASCGPGGEVCRGPWKPRPKPKSWWR